VEQLIEGVLTVRAGRSPDDRAGRSWSRRAGALHALAVALHVELLEMIGQELQVLAVREHGRRLGSQYVAIPDPEQSEQHGQVALEWRGSEMFVHRARSLEQRAEAVRTDRERDRQADRRPQ